ncbi:MAG: tetratricopeptide repeat protein [Spirochaetes bacterium]|nr:tetratricopeptide repeat protein [Spirochaetota bacterium]
MRKAFLVLIFISIIITTPHLFAADYSQVLFDQALEAFKSGNYASSELLLRKIVDEESNGYREKAWYYLALSIFNQKRYKSAIFEFNRFMTVCTSMELCSLARYWIAESLYQQNENIKSIQEFKRFISISKNDEYTVKAYDRIGRIYFSQQRYDEAIIEWMKAFSKCSDKEKTGQQRLNIGEAYFLTGKYDEAIDFLKPLLHSNTDTKIRSTAILITGRSHQIQGKNKTAIKIFSDMDESLIGERPFSDVQYYRAISYIKLANLNFASMHLESFLSIAKDSKWIFSAKFELAIIYLKEAKTKEAAVLFEQIRNSDANPALRSRSLMELSKLYFDDNIGEAIKCLKEAVEFESSDFKKQALVMLSNAYIKTNRLEEAETILEELLKNYAYDKNIDSIHFLIGRVYLEKKDFKRAISAFDKVKQVNPFSKYINETGFYLGIAYSENNQPEKAVATLKKYINIKNIENRYKAYVRLLHLYTGEKDYKNAEKTISTIIKYYKNENKAEDVIYEYAEILEKNKKSGRKYFDLIVSNYNKTPAAGRVLLSRGDDAFVKKEYSNAEKYYRQYLSVQWRQNASSVFLYYLISLEKTEKYRKIITISETENSIPPMDDYTAKQVQLLLGKSYFKTNEYKKALDSYSVWRLDDLSAGDLLITAKSSLQINDITTAVRAADLIKGNNGFYTEALYDLSLYYIQNKDYHNAYYYLSTIINDYPSSAFVDSAKIETAELNIKEEKYEEALANLKDIKNKNLQPRKDALLILIHFRTGNDKDAVSMTDKSLKKIRTSEYAEAVIKENLLFYYRNNDIPNFNKFAGYLKNYYGNTVFLNYMYGKLYFNTNKYKTSYYYFRKIADIESKYRDEAVYTLGLISLLKNKNSRLAFQYFRELSEKNDTDSKFAMMGKIDLSILSNEMGDIELSRKMLMDIINKSENRLLRIQAENLADYFGYKTGNKITAE